VHYRIQGLLENRATEVYRVRQAVRGRLRGGATGAAYVQHRVHESVARRSPSRRDQPQLSCLRDGAAVASYTRPLRSTRPEPEHARSGVHVDAPRSFTDKRMRSEQSATDVMESGPRSMSNKRRVHPPTRPPSCRARRKRQPRLRQPVDQTPRRTTLCRCIGDPVEVTGSRRETVPRTATSGSGPRLVGLSTPLTSRRQLTAPRGWPGRARALARGGGLRLGWPARVCPSAGWPSARGGRVPSWAVRGLPGAGVWPRRPGDASVQTCRGKSA